MSLESFQFSRAWITSSADISTFLPPALTRTSARPKVRSRLQTTTNPHTASGHLLVVCSLEQRLFVSSSSRHPPPATHQPRRGESTFGMSPQGLQRTCPTLKIRMVPFQALPWRWKPATTRTRTRTTICKTFNRSRRLPPSSPFSLASIRLYSSMLVSLVPITYGPVADLMGTGSSQSQCASPSGDLAPNSH